MGNCSTSSEREVPWGPRRPEEHKAMPVAPPPKQSGHLAEAMVGHHGRHCTDLACVPIFLVFFVALASILRYASIHGERDRVFRGLDYHDQVCGSTSVVKDKPFLYWCGKPGANLTGEALRHIGAPLGVQVLAFASTLDLEHPICVEVCPGNSSGYHSCFQQEVATEAARDVNGSLTRKITYVHGLVQDVPTRPIAGHYCMPMDTPHLESLQQYFSGYRSVVFTVAGVHDQWHIVAASAFFAFCLSYIFMLLVTVIARPLAYTTVTLATLACLGLGGALLCGVVYSDNKTAFAQHFDPAAMDNAVSYIPTTGHKGVDTAISLGFLVLGVLLPVLACCTRRSMELVFTSLAATTECLQDMPVFFLQPLISVAIRLAFLAVALWGFIQVISIGEVSNYKVDGHVPAGIWRRYAFEEVELYYVGGYLLICMWLFEFMSALEQLVLIQGTQLWFYTPYRVNELGAKRKTVGQCGVCRGVFLGLTYHLGTVTLGSILAMPRTLCTVVSLVYSQAHTRTGDVNKVAQVAVGACMCCLQCWEAIIRYLNKMVYVVVIMKSQDYCSAAETVVELIASEFTAIGILQGATRVFQVCGLITVSSVCGGVTLFALKNLTAFTDISSKHFVPYPEHVAVASALVALLVAAVYMTVFDTVAETILFCYALDRKTRRDDGLPPGLNLPTAMRHLGEDSAATGKAEKTTLLASKH